MENLKLMAKAAKQRLKNRFWEDCKKNLDMGADFARERGLNEGRVIKNIKTLVKKKINREAEDEFYLKVKKLLDEEGEVSDAIGRLTDREYYNSLSYEDRQRYTLKLSGEYLRALEKYRKEKQINFN